MTQDPEDEIAFLVEERKAMSLMAKARPLQTVNFGSPASPGIWTAHPSWRRQLAVLLDVSQSVWSEPFDRWPCDLEDIPGLIERAEFKMRHWWRDGRMLWSRWA